MLKRIIAAVMALITVLSLFAVSASAETAVTYGDVNKDGNVNSSDALNTLQASTGLINLTLYQEALADVNADSKINSSDALSILQFSTGIITKFNKDYSKTLKATKVDPIIDSGKYTFGFNISLKELGIDLGNSDSSGELSSEQMELIANSKVDMLLSTDGENRVMSATMLELMEVRYLYKDGKNYQIVPKIDLGQSGTYGGTYCETDDFSPAFDKFLVFFTKGLVYSGTTTEKEFLLTYTCETFCTPSGAKLTYYFYNNKLTKMILTTEEETREFDVSTLEKGAREDLFVIPEDCVYSEEYMMTAM